jgi:uncharacterized protein
MTPETLIAPDIDTILHDRLHVTRDAIEAFCHQWNIVEFSLFGSVLREDFREDSDVDVLVCFAEEARWHLFDLMEMQRQFEAMVGRFLRIALLTIDLVEKVSLKNLYRRANILRTYQVIYAT